MQHARGGEARKSAPCSFTRCFDFSSFSRHTGGSFYPEKRSLNTLPEMTFASNLDKQERNELILSCYKRKRGNELNFLIHREQREATSTGSLKKILTLKSVYSFKMLIRWPFYYLPAVGGYAWTEGKLDNKENTGEFSVDKTMDKVYQQCVLVFICISHASVTCFVSSWSRFEAKKWNKREAVQAGLNGHCTQARGFV